MRIPSGVTDQYIYFVAVDSTDLKTRETGLSSFTVYRSRNGGAAAAFTTPTINETDATNMPGVYELLLDEDMTIDAGDDSQEMVFHITQASMAPVTRTIELYRPKITAGNTLDVTATGAAGIDWGNVENPTTAVNLSATNIDADQVVASVTGAVGSVTGAVGSVTAMVTANVTQISGDSVAADNAEAFFDGTGYAGTNNVIPTVTTLTGHTAQTGDAYARLGAPAGASVSADIAAVKAETASILTDTAEIGAAGAGLTALASQASVNTIDDFLDTEIAAILADTNELQTDWANGGRLDLLLDTAAAGGAAASYGIVDEGTAQSATSTSLVLRSAAGFANDELIGATILITGGTGAGQARIITDYVGSTDTATVDTWTTTPSGTITYKVFGTPPASATSVPAVNVVQVGGSTTDVSALATNVAAILVDTGTTLDGKLNTIDDFLDTEVAAILAAVDTEVAAILADTNELQTDWANGGRLDLLLDGAASAGDPWTTTLPGAYGAGTAGYIVGTNINATVSSRASQTSVDTIDDFLDTEIAAILADTNELQTDWANGGRLDLLLDGAASAGDPWTTALPGAYGAGTAGYIVGTNLDATVSTRATQTSVDTVDNLIDTEVAAIKSVVDDILLDTAEIGAAGAGLTAVASAATAAAIEADTQNIQSRIPAALDNGYITASVKRVGDTTLTAGGTGTQGYGG